MKYSSRGKKCALGIDHDGTARVGFGRLGELFTTTPKARSASTRRVDRVREAVSAGIWTQLRGVERRHDAEAAHRLSVWTVGYPHLKLRR